MSDRQRVPTAVVLLAGLFIIVQWGSVLSFFILLQAIIAAALWEFYNLARRRRWRPQRTIGLLLAILIGATFYFPRFPLALALFIGLFAAGVYFVAAFNTLEKAAVFPPALALTFFGAVYVALPLNYLFWIRRWGGPEYLYFLFLIVFLGDTGAYLIGKAIGRRKMTPIASPNKTWEGCAGGILFAVLGAITARILWFPEAGILSAVLCGVIVNLVAQVSDPLESLFKRAVGVKDSSNLLPGHGGFLDRLDSFLLAAPLFYYFVQIFWK